MGIADYGLNPGCSRSPDWGATAKPCHPHTNCERSPSRNIWPESSSPRCGTSTWTVRCAVVGSAARHNLINLAWVARLRAHMTGKGCSTFMSDMNVRSGAVFYYPDVVVTCRQVASDALFVTEPKLIVEVLSESTQGRDRIRIRTRQRFHAVTIVKGRA